MSSSSEPLFLALRDIQSAFAAAEAEGASSRARIAFLKETAEQG